MDFTWLQTTHAQIDALPFLTVKIVQQLIILVPMCAMIAMRCIRFAQMDLVPIFAVLKIALWIWVDRAIVHQVSINKMEHVKIVQLTAFNALKLIV